MRRALLALPVIVLFGGCVLKLGRGPEEYVMVRSPAGVRGTVVMRGASELVIGELLAVRDTALVMLQGYRVSVIPYSAISRARFDDAGVYFGAGTPDLRVREELRAFSRYPADIPPAVMTALMAPRPTMTPPAPATPAPATPAR